jgi:hypothetical protein
MNDATTPGLPLQDHGEATRRRAPSATHTNVTAALVREIQAYARKFPNALDSQIAQAFSTSRTTVRNILNDFYLIAPTGNDGGEVALSRSSPAGRAVLAARANAAAEGVLAIPAPPPGMPQTEANLTVETVGTAEVKPWPDGAILVNGELVVPSDAALLRHPVEPPKAVEPEPIVVSRYTCFNCEFWGTTPAPDGTPILMSRTQKDVTDGLAPCGRPVRSVVPWRRRIVGTLTNGRSTCEAHSTLSTDDARTLLPSRVRLVS